MISLTTDDIILYWFYLYKLSFLIGLVSIAIAKLYIPDFLEYGKTLKDHPEKRQSFVDWIMHFTVPKSYFAHFYVLSTVLSIASLCAYYKYALVWLILIHSARRLYETLYVSKYTTNSRMNWSHYVVGIWFYSAFHIILNIKLYQGQIPREISYFSTALFIWASIDQYNNHATLSQLIKYSLPKAGFFQYLCCPHYFDEILIYASFVAYNHCFLWPLIWVMVSLSVSAIESRAYYQNKFKDEQVPSYAIVPFLL